MGIFSKSKPKADSGVSQESLEAFITKFQQMFPESFREEINGAIFTTSDVRQFVASLTNFANKEQDQQLLHFVARACLVSSDEFGRQDISVIAQTLMDDFGVSLELRKRYSRYQDVVLQVTVLGVASIKVLENNPKYEQVLKYISNINKK